MVRQSRQGVASRGQASRGTAVQAWRGKAGLGEVRLGRAVTSSYKHRKCYHALAVFFSLVQTLALSCVPSASQVRPKCGPSAALVRR